MEVLNSPAALPKRRVRRVRRHQSMGNIPQDKIAVDFGKTSNMNQKRNVRRQETAGDLLARLEGLDESDEETNNETTTTDNNHVLIESCTQQNILVNTSVKSEISNMPNRIEIKKKATMMNMASAVEMLGCVEGLYDSNDINITETLTTNNQNENNTNKDKTEQHDKVTDEEKEYKQMMGLKPQNKKWSSMLKRKDTKKKLKDLDPELAEKKRIYEEYVKQMADDQNRECHKENLKLNTIEKSLKNGLRSRDTGTVRVDSMHEHRERAILLEKQSRGLIKMSSNGSLIPAKNDNDIKEEPEEEEEEGEEEEDESSEEESSSDDEAIRHYSFQIKQQKSHYVEKEDDYEDYRVERPYYALKIHDAEVGFEGAKKDTEKLRKVYEELRFDWKDEFGSDLSGLPGVKCNLKDLPDVLMLDTGNLIADSNRWPLVIDGTQKAVAFLRNRSQCYINALNQRSMAPEQIRFKLVDALRFGKPLVLDLMNVDVFLACQLRFDEVFEGLMNAIMDRSIMQEEKYLPLLREKDGPDYQKAKFKPQRTQHFRLFLVTQALFPPQPLLNRTYPITVLAKLEDHLI